MCDEKKTIEIGIQSQIILFSSVLQLFY